MAVMSHGVPLIVDSAKRDLGAMIEWGRQKMADGAYEVAAQHFTAALDLKPGLMHALVSRGFCFLTLGDADKAQRDFAEVISKDAGFNRNVYVLIALCLKRSGDYRTAIRYLTRCIGQFASFKPALIARGELGLKVRDYEKARADFRRVLASAPSDLVARRGLADALRGLGNFREALRQYSRAVEDATQILQKQERQSQGRQDSDRTLGGHNDETDFDREFTELSKEVANEREHDAPLYFPNDEKEVDGSLVAIGPASAALKDSFGADADPARVKGFVADALLRRALLLRLTGDLEAAGDSLLEALQLDIEDGATAFWYGKVLIEQGRHKEAPGFLQASMQHNEELRPFAHALLGAMLMNWSDPDPQAALLHLREAARLRPSSQPVRVTLWICQAMAALRQAPRDPVTALQLLDRALATLCPASSAGAAAGGGRASPRPLPAGLTPRGHVAGSGGAAVAALLGKSPEETRWSATKALERKRQELAQGGDLEMALDCRTFLQLVAEDPEHRQAEVPFLLYALRTVALCDLGRWDEAVNDCRKALAIDPKDEAAQYTMHIASGILRVKCGKFESAVACFSKAIRLQPISAEARIHRAIALARAAQFGPAAASSGGGSSSSSAAAPGSHLASVQPSLPGSGVPSGVRTGQFLEEAVQDLEAVEQQAQISGRTVPIGAGHLRSACLCSLGRPQEAHEVLLQLRELGQGTPQAMARQSSLEAEVLMLLNEHRDAVDACSAMIASSSPGASSQVEARLMRGCCWSELGEVDRAFEDYREALILAPHRADVHEASGELFLLHRCFQEAVTAFTTAAKLTEASSPRISYKRALAHLGMGNAVAAFKDMARASRICPNMPVAVRARDGLGALQSVVDGDFRQAHVRFNVLLHTPIPPSSDRLPVVLFPFEVAVYRGLCCMYLGEALAAVQDFGAAVELAEQEFQSDMAEVSEGGSAQRSAPTSGAGSTMSQHQRDLRRHPDVASREAVDCFDCEARYNIVLCQLLTKQYRAALATCHSILELETALFELGEKAACLVYFLVGVCCLALGESSDEAARDAFTKSYALDPRYVDDFLRRHGRRGEAGAAARQDAPPPAKASAASTPVQQRVGAPPPASGGAARPSAVPTHHCDAAPEVICNFRASKSRFTARLPPLRIQVRDVVIWARPSAAWPAIRPCGPAPPQGLARLDLLQQHEAASMADA